MIGFYFACAGMAFYLALIVVEEVKIAFARYLRELEVAWPRDADDVYRECN